MKESSIIPIAAASYLYRRVAVADSSESGGGRNAKVGKSDIDVYAERLRILEYQLKCFYKLSIRHWRVISQLVRASLWG